MADSNSNTMAKTIQRNELREEKSTKFMKQSLVSN